MLIEPQVQVIYTSYNAKDHTEDNGTRVHSEDSGGIITRVGGRLFGRNITDDGRMIHAFHRVELVA